MKCKIAGVIVLMGGIGLALSACGIKGPLEAPPGEQGETGQVPPAPSPSRVFN